MKRIISSHPLFRIPFFVMALLLYSCGVNFSIDHPETSEPDSIFYVPINYYVSGSGYGPPGPYVPLFGVHIPVGWTVRDSIALYDSISNPPGTPIGHIIYSQTLSDSMSQQHPADPGYYWWVGQAPSYINHFNISSLVIVDPPDTTGSFLIDYFGGTNMLNPVDYVIIKNVNITMGLPDTQYVTTNANAGVGSLRWAVEHVSHNGVLQFKLGPQDTIKLTESIEIYSSLTIDGGPNMLVIDGENNCTVFVIDGYDNSATLQNLVITGGKGKDGGGILCTGCSSLALSNVRLTGNQAERGAGICADHPWENPYVVIIDIDSMMCLKMNNVVIRNNYATQTGGGLYANTRKVSIETSAIENNQAVQSGGGLSFYRCPIEIINTLIAGNASKFAGGVNSTTYDPVSVINTTVADNYSDSAGAGGIDFGWHYDFDGSIIKMENNIFWGNFNPQGPASLGLSTANPLHASKINLSHCVFASNSVIGNLPVTVTACIYTSPLFDSLSPDHPYSLSPSSPCIDAGVNPPGPDFPSTDLLGHPRFLDGDNNGDTVIDIGAYELDPGWAGIDKNPGVNIERLQVDVYPNPGSDYLNVRIANHNNHRLTMSLYTIHGRKVWTGNFSPAASGVVTRQIDLRSYDAAVYILEVSSGLDRVQQKLVVK